MKFILGDYFKIKFPEAYFDGIITDIPYVGAINGKLNTNNFSIGKFLEKSAGETKKDSFLITFTNFRCATDLMLMAPVHGWKYHTHMIWDKRPQRNWISWSHPLRHTEFIMFFNKGNFKFSFKNGKIVSGYKRKTFGGDLKNDVIDKERKVSYGMYQEIIELTYTKRKKHPAEKPILFSDMFTKIVGEDMFVLDPFAGSGNLIYSFNTSVGVDIKKYIED